VGARIVPVFSLDQGAFFAFTFGVVALLGGLLQINPIWNLGPYNPAQVSAGTAPDFYMMWTDGFLRLFPAWELYPFHHTIPGAFAVAILMPLIFAALLLYPSVEQRLTKDTARHNLLQRPRDVPVRTAIGAMSLAFYVILTLACCNDIIALQFHVSLNATTWFGRIAVLLAPPLAYFATYRMCLGLQRRDRAVLAHGIETGVIRRLPHGEYIELHQPLGPVDAEGHPIPLEYQAAPVPHKMNQLGLAGRPGIGAFFRADPETERDALAADEHEAERARHAMLRDYQDRVSP
jgi:ubiquinol-cytochrome c reductase cytochrome b subunit